MAGINLPPSGARGAQPVQTAKPAQAAPKPTPTAPNAKAQPGQVLLSPQDLFKSLPAAGKSAPTIPLVEPPKAKPVPTPPKAAAPATPVLPSLPKAAAPAAVKGTVVGTPKGSGYYPHNSKMEGGYNDMLGKPLKTLQDFLEGKSKYVSVALDKNMYEHIIKDGRERYAKTGKAKYKKYLTMEPKIKYGDTFRIPELEKKHGRQIIFKAVDTGGAFENKGFSRIDIATRSDAHSKEKTVNGKLTLVKQ